MSAVRMHTTVEGLDAAHTTVHPALELVLVEIGTPDVRVTLIDTRPAVRQVLADALAQLDAIDAQHPEDGGS